METHIIVEEEQEIALSRVRASIESGREAMILTQGEPTHVKGAGYGRRVVSGCVVYYDDFQVPIRLTKERRQTNLKISCSVPVGHNRGNQRYRSHNPVRATSNWRLSLCDRLKCGSPTARYVLCDFDVLEDTVLAGTMGLDPLGHVEETLHTSHAVNGPWVENQDRE
jgi:hypothetical protein